MEEPRLAYRVAEAHELVGLSRTAFYELLGRGEIRSVRVGRTRLVPAAALREWLDGLEGGAPEDAP